MKLWIRIDTLCKFQSKQRPYKNTVLKCHFWWIKTFYSCYIIHYILCWFKTFNDKIKYFLWYESDIVWIPVFLSTVKYFSQGIWLKNKLLTAGWLTQHFCVLSIKRPSVASSHTRMLKCDCFMPIVSSF